MKSEPTPLVSPTLPNRRSSLTRSLAAVFLLVSAAALLLSGCTIDDARTGEPGVEGRPGGSFSKSDDWSGQDPVHPRQVPAGRRPSKAATPAKTEPK